MIAFAWLFSVGLVPLPEMPPAEPGAVLRITLAEGETEEDLARRIELHVELLPCSGTCWEASANPELANLAVVAEVVGGRQGTLLRGFLTDWMAENIELEVRRDLGEIRVWFREGTEAERVIMTNAVIDGYLVTLERGRAHVERNVQRCKDIVSRKERPIHLLERSIRNYNQAEEVTPRIVQKIEEMAQEVQKLKAELPPLQAEVARYQHELQDLDAVEILSRAGNPEPEN